MNINRFIRYLLVVGICFIFCFSATLNSTVVPKILTFEGTFIDSKEGMIHGIKKIDISINEGADPDKNITTCLFLTVFIICHFKKLFITI